MASPYEFSLGTIRGGMASCPGDIAAWREVIEECLQEGLDADEVRRALENAGHLSGVRTACDICEESQGEVEDLEWEILVKDDIIGGLVEDLEKARKKIETLEGVLATATAGAP